MTFFHRIFHRNLPIKIMAILTATVLWFYVMNNQNPSIEATIKREVQLVNIPDGKVVSLEENKVNIKVRALRSYFVSTAGSEFRAELDAEDLPNGRIREKVSVILPHGFELIEVDPPELPVFVDPIEKSWRISSLSPPALPPRELPWPASAATWSRRRSSALPPGPGRYQGSSPMSL